MITSKLSNTYLSYILAIGGVVAALGIGILSLEAPLLMLIAIILSIVGVLSFSYPNLATQVFVFLLYTNATVIATRFHGVPFVVSAAFPLMLLIPLAYFVLFKKERIIITHHIYLVIGLLLVQILGTLFSIDMSIAFENLITFAIEGLAMYVLVVNVIRTPKAIKLVLLALFGATLLMGILPIVQYTTGLDNNQFFGFAQVEDEYGFTVSETLTRTESQTRYAGPIGEKNRYAQTMFMLMFIAVPHILGTTDRRWQLLALLTTGIAAAAGVLAFSRGAAVGIAMTFVIALMIRAISWRDAAFLLLGCLLIFMIFPQYLGRITSLTSVTALFGIQTETVQYEEPDNALRGRLTQMWAAWIVYLDHPIVGVGPEMFKYYAQDVGNQLGLRRLEDTRRSHSLYFDLLSNTGTLGTLSFSMLIFLVLRGLMRIRRDEHQTLFLRTTATGFILGLVFYLASGLFLHFAYIRYFWVTLAIATCIIYVARPLAHLPPK